MQVAYAGVRDGGDWVPVVNDEIGKSLPKTYRVMNSPSTTLDSISTPRGLVQKLEPSCSARIVPEDSAEPAPTCSQTLRACFEL